MKIFEPEGSTCKKKHCFGFLRKIEKKPPVTLFVNDSCTVVLVFAFALTLLSVFPFSCLLSRVLFLNYKKSEKMVSFLIRFGLFKNYSIENISSNHKQYCFRSHQFRRPLRIARLSPFTVKKVNKPALPSSCQQFFGLQSVPTLSTMFTPTFARIVVLHMPSHEKLVSSLSFLSRIYFFTLFHSFRPFLPFSYSFYFLFLLMMKKRSVFMILCDFKTLLFSDLNSFLFFPFVFVLKIETISKICFVFVICRSPNQC